MNEGGIDWQESNRLPFKEYGTLQVKGRVEVVTLIVQSQVSRDF